MNESSEPRHPIRVVAQRTGLSTPVLRAWERRYGAVQPQRSEGRQRLYSDADIRRLQLLATAVDGGRSIGLIADLPIEELEALIDEDRAAPAVPIGGAISPDAERLDHAMRLIEELRGDELERYLRHSMIQLRPQELVDGLMVPLLHEVGRAWQAGRMGPSTEHIASVSIRRFLEWVSSVNQARSVAPLVVTGTPAGQRHEFGALLAGLIAAYEGWRVRFLGPDLPAEEIVHAAEKLGASIVALSAVHPRLDADGIAEVVAVRRGLPPNVRVVIGGGGADPYHDRWVEEGIDNPASLADFRDSLGLERPTPMAAGV
jgi:DNA-binding transcriptional MerR regulator/methylmalonyl-CoA mutase cobalamin-binding subunit